LGYGAKALFMALGALDTVYSVWQVHAYMEFGNTLVAHYLIIGLDRAAASRGEGLDQGYLESVSHGPSLRLVK
jgi:hypothetical protein